MKNLIVRFVRDEQGQDLIEYTLLLALPENFDMA